MTHLLPLLLVLYACLLPPEMRLNLGAQTIYAPRLVSLLVFPLSLSALFQGGRRLQWSDSLVLVGCLWMIVSFVAIYGMADGVVRGLGLVIDVLFPYLIARAAIRDMQDLRRVLIMLAPALILVAGSLAAESLSRHFIVRPLAVKIFGALPATGNAQTAAGETALAEDYRLGMLRAYGPFSHPILGGVTMASLFAPFFLSRIKGWPLAVGCLTAFASIFSGSSAAILALMIGIGAGIFERVQRALGISAWKPLIGAVIILLILIQLTSNSGVFGLAARLSVNPQTAYFRQLIWEFGTQSVIEHPWFGIGYNNYQAAAWGGGGSSIDHYWLMLAVRFGVITSFSLLGASVYVILRLGSLSRNVTGADQQFCVGIAIALFVFVLTTFTVALFGSAQAWFFAFLGCGATLIDVHSLSASPADPKQAQAIPSRGRLQRA